MLDCGICPLVSIVSQLVMAQMEYNILQRFWDDSDFKFVAIFYNGSKKYIISDEIKLIVLPRYYLVMKIPNFRVIPLLYINLECTALVILDLLINVRLVSTRSGFKLVTVTI